MTHFYVYVSFRPAVQLAPYRPRITLLALCTPTQKGSTSHYSFSLVHTDTERLYESFVGSGVLPFAASCSTGHYSLELVIIDTKMLYESFEFPTPQVIDTRGRALVLVCRVGSITLRCILLCESLSTLRCILLYESLVLVCRVGSITLRCILLYGSLLFRAGHYRHKDALRVI